MPADVVTILRVRNFAIWSRIFALSAAAEAKLESSAGARLQR